MPHSQHHSQHRSPLTDAAALAEPDGAPGAEQPRWETSFVVHTVPGPALSTALELSMLMVSLDRPLSPVHHARARRRRLRGGYRVAVVHSAPGALAARQRAGRALSVASAEANVVVDGLRVRAAR